MQGTPREKLSLRWLQPQTSPACKLVWSILSKAGCTKITRFQALFHAFTCFSPKSILKEQTQLFPSVQKLQSSTECFSSRRKGDRHAHYTHAWAHLWTACPGWEIQMNNRVFSSWCVMFIAQRKIINPRYCGFSSCAWSNLENLFTSCSPSSA